ncbi:MAG: ATP-dependent helicase [Calditrichia bacterium]
MPPKNTKVEALWNFSPLIGAWFKNRFPGPTPPQRAAWPVIQKGENTLIVSPTGSGKTLSAFLWGIDSLYRKLRNPEISLEKGVRILYLSPLKALNNDIYRNLQQPLAEIRKLAAQRGEDFPEIRVAVRSGDTPGKDRASMVKNPPDILITTPESLYLILTSPRARQMLRTVETVIVDEIHTLVGNKRGAHLALSLERVEELASRPFQRIGLSATVNPLQETAAFLAGIDGKGHARPIHIIDTPYRKELELRVVSAVDDFENLPGNSIWPLIVRQVIELIKQHRTTLVFVNNRRTAERLTDWLNRSWVEEEDAMVRDGVATGLGLFTDRPAPAKGPIMAHHGSISKNLRLQIEEKLKKGELPAIVGTSSLELGIDIGSIDLVIQIQSPRSAARGLQRVGRSGHLVGQKSKGVFFPTHAEDLLETVAIVQAMKEGKLEPLKSPQNPLDVLAQQIVGMVAVETWQADRLFEVVKRAWPYRTLPYNHFISVLEMLSGKFAGKYQKQLRPRISWDRTTNTLAALAGTRMVAITNAGTITDKGSYQAYLADRNTRIGELDEEFVYESRVGDTIRFGAQVWRIQEITEDRLILSPAPGQSARMPFWRGEYPWRHPDTSHMLNRLRNEIWEELQRKTNFSKLSKQHDLNSPDLRAQISAIAQSVADKYDLDQNSALALIRHIWQTCRSTGILSDQANILLERLTDSLGDHRLVIHSPFGGKVNSAWAMILTARIRRLTSINPEVQYNDDGILFRLPDLESLPDAKTLLYLNPSEAEKLLLEELPQSALFGARFRENAARALLLPGAGPKKRTAFWLQRLRARDLLATVKRFEDFPILQETYRDCLQDELEIVQLKKLLTEISEHKIRIHVFSAASPSPLAKELIYHFTSEYLYEWDQPKPSGGERKENTEVTRDRQYPPEEGIPVSDTTMGKVLRRQTPLGRVPGNAEELFICIDALGDVTPEELQELGGEATDAWLTELLEADRLLELSAIAEGMNNLWITPEQSSFYRDALIKKEPEKIEQLFLQFLENHPPTTKEKLLGRYPTVSEELEKVWEDRLEAGQLLEIEGALPRYTLPALWEAAQQEELRIQRNAVQTVPFNRFQKYLLEKHFLPKEQSLPSLLNLFSGLTYPLSIWQKQILGARCFRAEFKALQELVSTEEFYWYIDWNRKSTSPLIGFFQRGNGRLAVSVPQLPSEEKSRRLLEFLREETAVSTALIQQALGWSIGETARALTDLLYSGWISNTDLFIPPLENKPPNSGSHSPISRPDTSRLVVKPDYRRLKKVRRKIAKRLNTPFSFNPQTRWFYLHRYSILGPEISYEDRLRKWIEILLNRYGIIFRELLERENVPFTWYELYRELQLMEWRGKVLRGYFIESVHPIQFALPETIQALQAESTNSLPSAEAGYIVLNSLDPWNFQKYAPTAGLPVLSKSENNWLIYGKGRWLAAVEKGGKRWTVDPRLTDGEIYAVLQRFLKSSAIPKSYLQIETWNGKPVFHSNVEGILTGLGFYRSPYGFSKEL